MILYPEVQARAQAELDAVVGRDRIPTFADYEHLPYIRATVKEVCCFHSYRTDATPASAVLNSSLNWCRSLMAMCP